MRYNIIRWLNVEQWNKALRQELWAIAKTSSFMTADRHKHSHTLTVIVRAAQRELMC